MRSPIGSSEWLRANLNTFTTICRADRTRRSVSSVSPVLFYSMVGEDLLPSSLKLTAHIEKKRDDYDRRAKRARQGGDATPGAGGDSLGGVKVDNKDPEASSSASFLCPTTLNLSQAFFQNIFHTQGKQQGTENFENWLDLAFTGKGESDLGAVIHGNADLASGDKDKDDKVSKQLGEMGLADHTKQLSIPGAEDGAFSDAYCSSLEIQGRTAKRHFKSSRARTTHTNRKGETTVQRTGTSVAMIDGGALSSLLKNRWLTVTCANRRQRQHHR